MLFRSDKEGFLRSETSLVQTAGRAARHVDGRVILYADAVTDSMRRMIEITDRRRAAQLAFNREHGIAPRSIRKSLQESLAREDEAKELSAAVVREAGAEYGSEQELIAELEREMIEAAEALEYERAALLRDHIRERRGAGPAEPRGAARDGARRGRASGGKGRQAPPSGGRAP